MAGHGHLSIIEVGAQLDARIMTAIIAMAMTEIGQGQMTEIKITVETVGRIMVTKVVTIVGKGHTHVIIGQDREPQIEG